MKFDDLYTLCEHTEQKIYFANYSDNHKTDNHKNDLMIIIAKDLEEAYTNICRYYNQTINEFIFWEVGIARHGLASMQGNIKSNGNIAVYLKANDRLIQPINTLQKQLLAIEEGGGISFAIGKQVNTDRGGGKIKFYSLGNANQEWKTGRILDLDYMFPNTGVVITSFNDIVRHNMIHKYDSPEDREHATDMLDALD